MDIKEKIKLKALLIILILTSSAYGWGKKGHRIVASIAYENLSSSTKIKIGKILGDKNFVDASTWADEIKSDPKFHYAKPYHYLNVDDSGKVIKGINILSILKKIEKQISDNRLPLEKRKVALMFMIHLLADLHNPMHLGLASDRGGNDFHVKWKGKKSNLHRVWDEQLIEFHNVSYSEYKDFLLPIKDSQKKNWSIGSYKSWANQSMEIRKKIYPDKKANLSYSYHFKWKKDLDLLLKKAGVRLAYILEKLL